MKQEYVSVEQGYVPVEQEHAPVEQGYVPVEQEHAPVELEYGPMSPDQPAGPADEDLLAALTRASGTVPEALRRSVHDAVGLFCQAEGDVAEGAR